MSNLSHTYLIWLQASFKYITELINLDAFHIEVGRETPSGVLCAQWVGTELVSDLDRK